jgi:uncharacterized repeat protein (TIGR03803 family)
MTPKLFRGALGICASIAILTSGVSAQTEQIIYSFGPNDPGSPYLDLVADGKGNLYGTSEGGSSSQGTVFELSPSSNGPWSRRDIYSFTGFNSTGDGAVPVGRLTFDSKGNLYGTTYQGGAYQQGTVFELTPASNGTWTEKVLHSFAGSPDGTGLYASQGVIVDASGNLYGTTGNGGTYGSGVVFQLVPGASGTWTENILHNFTGGNDGGFPIARLIRDSAGHLFGSAFGGAHDYGLLFELIQGTNGSWTERIIYSFTGGAGGSAPEGKLAFGPTGKLYAAIGFALVELAPINGVWTFRNIHEFTGGTDGAGAESGLVFDKAGSLYGTTGTGGFHRGTVYELSPQSDGSWSEKILHKFIGGNDGAGPQFGTLILDAAGNLYGATGAGGASLAGVVYKITP